MFDRSFPKEVEVKRELVIKIQERFKFKFPPLLKLLLTNFNSSFFRFYPTIDQLFKNSGLEFDFYMSDKRLEEFNLNSINSPLRIYNDLIAYPFVYNALVEFEQLAIGRFGHSYLFVGVGEANQDVVFYHVYENDELVPKRLENNIFQFISKYKLSLPLNSEGMERGILENYWLSLNNKILLDMKNFEPNEREEKCIDFDNLVDNIYNKIMEYVQS